jgi:hypothetical protein
MRTVQYFPVCLIGVALMTLLGCGSSGPIRAQSDALKDAKGAIQAVRPADGWYAIVPDSDRGTRYAPDRLPDEFKVDGLRVVFSGRIKPVDPNVRSWGVPFELTSIRRE